MTAARGDYPPPVITIDVAPQHHGVAFYVLVGLVVLVVLRRSRYRFSTTVG